jgi:FtsP/CotA-like multicopper oxidase with cupredoxin domain
VPVRRDDTTDYYAMHMMPTYSEIVPGYQTLLFGYEGSVPGPTIKVSQGRKAVVRHCNNLPAAHPTYGYEPWTSVHLHGSASLPQFDGYASDITRPNQFKDYQYPNFQPARTLWYHDHGIHHTAENVSMGRQASTTSSTLWSRASPSRRVRRTLTVGDTMLNSDGSLLFAQRRVGFFGDVIS